MYPVASPSRPTKVFFCVSRSIFGQEWRELVAWVQVTDAGAGTQVVGDYVLHEKLGQGRR